MILPAYFPRPSWLWSAACGLYALAIFFYVLLSWIPDKGPFWGAYRWLAAICEPYISLFRRILPTEWMASTGFDLSPLVAWAVLSWVIRPLGSAILRLVGL